MTSTVPASMGEPLSEADPYGPYCECSAMRALVDYHLKPLSAERDEARARVGVLEGQLAKARELHQPERRYTPDGGESSYATFEEAADAHDGTFVEVTHFDVCSHCASMELGDGYTLDYRESLWPCKDAVALGLDGGGSDAE